MPFCASPRWNSMAISGSATPVMKTTSPSKNFPAVASPQICHCMIVIGTCGMVVPSGQTGVSSIYSWTVFFKAAALSFQKCLRYVVGWTVR